MKTNGQLNNLVEEVNFKLNGIDTVELENSEIDFIGENHIGSSVGTPLREDAFKVRDEQKMVLIENHFRQIMQIMGLDLTDDSLRGTPRRVSKMFVKEIFRGLDPSNKPEISLFQNSYRYNQMLVEKNIQVNSTCEHHFLPIIGNAHVAYISTGKVIGLSKINRIVDYIARRPQVQERMTVQIAQELKKALNTEDVAVVVEARHMCVSLRGIEDGSSTTLTAEYHGKFKDDKVREEFLKYISLGLVA